MWQDQSTMLAILDWLPVQPSKCFGIFSPHPQLAFYDCMQKLRTEIRKLIASGFQEYSFCKAFDSILQKGILPLLLQKECGCS